MRITPNWRLSGAAVLLAVATLLASAIATLPSAYAQTLTTIHSFCSQGTYPNCADGLYPVYGGVVQAANGNLYGTTSLGGAYFNPASCCGGTIFKITPDGALATLHSFCAQPACADGNSPQAGLVQATDGNLYGTTAGGKYNAGSIFKITPSGELVTLYSFCSQGSNCLDGESPIAGLVHATDGNLYGTTGTGGSHGDGTVFRITLGGQLTTLHNFCSQANCADGIDPGATLVQASDGNFYGTTYEGGADYGPANYGSGTAFKITPAGVFSTLYNFCSQPNCADGFNPNAGLIQGTDGNFYGTTYEDGEGGGTAFRLTPGGVLTTLYSFCAQGGAACVDGDNPIAGLIQASDGNFYGTTASGGEFGGGTIYSLTASGVLTTLYSFCSQGGCADGSSPYAGVTQDSNGDFYGATYEGGSSGHGTLFKLSLGLAPFLALQSVSGKVGSTVRILGDNLKGSTSVSFNGASAKLVAISDTAITATVPIGASTGLVRVMTTGGPLSSSVVFTVKAHTSTPVFSVPSGTYDGAQAVSILDATAGAVIRYTTDGTAPATSPSARAYTGPIIVGTSETLMAVALGPDDENSSAISAAYSIDDQSGQSPQCCDGTQAPRFGGGSCFGQKIPVHVSGPAASPEGCVTAPPAR